MSAAPATLPACPSIYRDLSHYNPDTVKEAIGRLVVSGKSITTLRVREIIDLQPGPPIVIEATPEPIDRHHCERVALAVMARHKPDGLALKLARCARHAGLTDAEEKYFRLMRARFPDMGYLPSANAYESGCACE